MAPNTAPNEMVKSPIRMPNATPLMASNRSAAATSQRPTASARTISTNSTRTMPEVSLPISPRRARLDAELARELSAARRLRRQRAVDDRVGDDEKKIERRDQRDREHDAPGDERREARIAGKQRERYRGNDDPGEQAHARERRGVASSSSVSRRPISRCTSSAGDGAGKQHARRVVDHLRRDRPCG